MPAILKLKADGKPVLRGFDHWWSVVRELGKGSAEFTITEIMGRSNGANRQSINEFMKRLVRAGYAEAVGWRLENSRRHRIYRLLKRPVDTPILGRGKGGRQGRCFQQMWNAIRALDTFTVSELAVAATTEDVEVKPSTAMAYVHFLRNAGYLSSREFKNRNMHHVHQLKPSMNTGPRAPKVLRAKIIYDPNRGQVIGNTVAEEVWP